MKRLVYILAPSSTEADYTVQFNSVNSGDRHFIYELTPNKVGIYQIRSTTYLDRYHPARDPVTGELVSGPSGVTFEIKSGAVSLYTTICKIISKTNKENLNEQVPAGQEALLVITIKDELDNLVILSEAESENFQAEINFQSAIKDLKEKSVGISDIIFPITFLFKGAYIIKATYKGKEINCLRCVFDIVTGPVAFENSELLVYSIKNKNFESTTKRYLFKSLKFQVS